MTEYQIQPITRRCHVTGRDLKVGERYYTALLEEGDHFVRQDFSTEVWQGPPPDAFSFWSGKVPPPEDAFKPRFDDDLLEECFQRLEGQEEPSRVHFRYVVALLLVRRRRLKLEQTSVDGGVEIMTLCCPRTQETYRVINPGLNEEAMSQAQNEVFQVLGWN